MKGKGMDPSEQAPSPEDTPTPDQGNVEQSDAGQVNWQERYDNLQPAYTQATQQLKQYEGWAEGLQSDPEVQQDTFRNLADAIGVQKALELLGYAEDGAEDPDPYSAQEQRLAQLEAKLQQQEASATEAQQLAGIEQYVDGWFDQQDTKLSKSQQDWIISRAVAIEPNAQGVIDLDRAYDEFTALLSEDRKSHVQSKRRAAIAPQGTAGTEQFDANDPEARKARMAAIAEAQADQ